MFCTVRAGQFDKHQVQSILEESLKMKRFNHRNVLGLIGVCVNAGPAPYLIMPYMANGSLLSYLKRERSNLVLINNADKDQVHLYARSQYNSNLYFR